MSHEPANHAWVSCSGVHAGLLRTACLPVNEGCIENACAGGANVPAMNDLLAPYGIAFGDAILEGQVGLDSEKLYYASGANIVRFPARGHVHGFYLADKASFGAFHICSNPAAVDTVWFIVSGLILFKSESMSHLLGDVWCVPGTSTLPGRVALLNRHVAKLFLMKPPDSLPARLFQRGLGLDT